MKVYPGMLNPLSSSCLSICKLGDSSWALSLASQINWQLTQYFVARFSSHHLFFVADFILNLNQSRTPVYNQTTDTLGQSCKANMNRVHPTLTAFPNIASTRNTSSAQSWINIFVLSQSLCIQFTYFPPLSSRHSKANEVCCQTLHCHCIALFISKISITTLQVCNFDLILGIL